MHGGYFKRKPETKVLFIEKHLKPALAVTYFINLIKRYLQLPVEDLQVEEKIKEGARTFVTKNLKLDPERVEDFLENYFTVSKKIQQYFREHELDGMDNYPYSEVEQEILSRMENDIPSIKVSESRSEQEAELFLETEEGKKTIDLALNWMRKFIATTNKEIYRGIQAENSWLNDQEDIHQQLSETISSVFKNKKLCAELKESVKKWSESLCACQLKSMNHSSANMLL